MHEAALAPPGACLTSAAQEGAGGCPCYRHLNSGWAMGPVGALRDVYSGAESYSDQLHATRYMLEHPERVTLDYAAQLVLNMAELKLSEVLDVDAGVVRNRVTGLVQCFLHGNGPSGKNAWRQLLMTLHDHHNR
uniref:Uncharacterized protein n=1 Tax=Alexandrium monilatum TaxID=311494 RepID=A0A7S4PXN8_9DINO